MPLLPEASPRVLRALFVALAVTLALALTALPHTARAATGDIVRGTVTSELALLYFRGLESLAVYTAADTTVGHGAVVGGDMTVLLAPAPDAPAVRDFAWGATIQFCVFNDAYYMARCNGTIVYIPASQVSLYAPSESGTIVRYAGSQGARAFAAPDESSALVSTFGAGKMLYFADFNDAWLMASMTQDGVRRTIFVPKADVCAEPPAQPSSDVWVITTGDAASYQGASYDSGTVDSYAKGHVFPAKTAGDGWYLVVNDGATQYLPAASVKVIDSSQYSITTQSYGLTLRQMVSLEYDNGGTENATHIVSRGGSWQTATADDIQRYVDPANFPEGTSGYFQFLVLSAPAGVSVSELNAQLAGMGVLDGQGQAFSDAAYAYGVNEAYLISHAIHETGRGTSQLACGLWYDPTTETAYSEQRPGTTLVYNMYGLGAYDSNPINGGAKMAYEKGWTSVYQAIVGGAQIIKSWYISPGADTLSGQDTLYKMLWHPEYADRYGERPWHQYATDVAWAYAQTYYLTQLYADYDNYSLVFEVPSYAGN